MEWKEIPLFILVVILVTLIVISLFIVDLIPIRKGIRELMSSDIEEDRHLAVILMRRRTRILSLVSLRLRAYCFFTKSLIPENNSKFKKNFSKRTARRDVEEDFFPNGIFSKFEYYERENN